jgi:radical SAM superfamily enzyme YgiQ (UPF0313 family)
MKPRVCFITPPSIFLLDERVFVALGILKVAAVAEQAGYPVEHLDLNGVVNYQDATLDHCARSEARIFAMTATTPQMPAVTILAKTIRAALPDAKLILGGPHPTLVYAAVKKHASSRALGAADQLESLFNVIVAGDGEDAIDLAIQTEAGVIDADDPNTLFFLTGKRLGELPFPARHLVDLKSYHYTIDGVPVTGLIGQLGCPFGCNFCAGRDSAMLRRVRLRPTENVIAEMRHIYEVHGIHGFMFFDDELNVNRQMLELMHAIDDLQCELGVGFRCRGFVKSELFTPTQAEAMYRAGFRRIMCGFESGSPRILKNINKNATLTDNTIAMEISHKYGLEMKALMSLGHPGESETTVQQTEDWLLAVKPADFDVTIITAYPGSPYYDRSRRVLSTDIWCFEVNGDFLYSIDLDYTQIADYYKGDPDGGYKSYVYTDHLSADDIVRLRDRVEREVRTKLQIPYYSAAAARRYEASMGMGKLPPFMLRTSEPE